MLEEKDHVIEARLQDIEAQMREAELSRSQAKLADEKLQEVAAAVLREKEQIIDALKARVHDMEAQMREAELSRSQAKLAEEKMQDATAAVLREKEQVINALKAHVQDSEMQMAVACRNTDRLTAALTEIMERQRNIEKSAAEQTAVLRRTNAAALAQSEAKAAAEVTELQDQLICAEATVAKLRTNNRSQSFWAHLMRSAGSRKAELILFQSGLFDTDWYRMQYPDAAKDGRAQVRHYLEEGYLLGYNPNPLFDSHWYLRQYADVRNSGVNPLVHYILHGYREGRDPSPEFDANFYATAYPDVRSAEVNPLAHYLRHGKAEGRMTKKPTSHR